MFHMEKYSIQHNLNIGPLDGNFWENSTIIGRRIVRLLSFSSASFELCGRRTGQLGTLLVLWVVSEFGLQHCRLQISCRLQYHISTRILSRGLAIHGWLISQVEPSLFSATSASLVRRSATFLLVVMWNLFSVRKYHDLCAYSNPNPNLETVVILSNPVEADGGVNAVGGCVEPVP